MSVIARHLLIRGHVQGVFFRAWTVKTASDLGLTGWVRNVRSGDVEAVVQGEPAAVDQFITLAHNGPPVARVDNIDQRDEPVSHYTGFEKRATV